MRRFWPEWVLLAVLSGLVILSLSLGASHIMPWRLWGASSDQARLARQVVLEIRLPRTVLALLVGASLGLSGTVLQGMLRNPLADPGVIGISATASLGAVLAFYFGLQAVVAGGILGSLAAVLLLTLLAGRRAGTLTLLLAGVALSSFAAGLTDLALNLAPSPFAAFEILFWLLGSVADRSWSQLAPVVPFMLAGWVLLASTGRGLDALALGEEVAHSLGIHLPRLRWSAVLGTALCVGASVAIAGAIGFVGLVVPHLLRPLVGPGARRLLPAASLGGATLLLAADIGVRLLSFDTELKLGVATALIGAPFFLMRLLTLRERG